MGDVTYIYEGLAPNGSMAQPTQTSQAGASFTDYCAHVQSKSTAQRVVRCVYLGENEFTTSGVYIARTMTDDVVDNFEQQIDKFAASFAQQKLEVHDAIKVFIVGKNQLLKL